MATKNAKLQTLGPAESLDQPSMAGAFDPAKLDKGGMFIIGEVIGRSRRQANLGEGKTRWVIQVSIMGGGEIYRADRWSDTPKPSDVPERGEKVCLFIRVRTFNTKTGTRTSFEWGPSHQTEEF